MATYKNVKTGKTVDMPESQYDQIKHQDNYVPLKKAPKKTVKKTTQKAK